MLAIVANPNTPPTIKYIPNFITPDEEAHLLAKVYSAPSPKWVALSNRRLQNWGATTAKQNSTTSLAEPLPDWLNSVAINIRDRTDTFAFVEANSEIGKPGFTQPLANNCLVNEYLSGQGIMPHLDGPAFKPTVATVSLGSHCVLQFYRKRSGDDAQELQADSALPKADYAILLQPRSLVIIHDEMYDTYLHGIREINADTFSKADIANWNDAGLGDAETDNDGFVTLERSTRVSLTFRVAAKVSKLNLFGKRRF
ncbi:hypothetical protein BC830DRAFT_1135495 [Chytriomyces sp. MP71]|nr:hypothetical protein BC830DRAFT_1135495 [Chytriomyces sp. MP71]